MNQTLALKTQITEMTPQMLDPRGKYHSLKMPDGYGCHFVIENGARCLRLFACDMDAARFALNEGIADWAVVSTTRPLFSGFRYFYLDGTTFKI